MTLTLSQMEASLRYCQLLGGGSGPVEKYPALRNSRLKSVVVYFCMVALSIDGAFAAQILLVAKG